MFVASRVTTATTPRRCWSREGLPSFRRSLLFSPTLQELTQETKHQSMSSGNPQPGTTTGNPDCLDIVTDAVGMGTVEIDTVNNGNGDGTRRSERQVSNLSLPEKKSQIPGTASNLVNSIVGAGIIGMPFALRQSGIIAGVLLLILVSYFTGT